MIEEMKIGYSKAKTDVQLKGKIIMNLKAGKTIDSMEMADNLGLEHVDVIAVFNELVVNKEAKEVV